MKITFNFFKETDYFKEEDDTFYKFEHGFKFTFEYEKFNTSITIRNPYTRSKNQWLELYDAVDKGQYYKLKLSSDYIECTDDQIHFKLGNQKEYYQFKYDHSDGGWGSNCEISIPLAECKEDFLNALKFFLDHPTSNKYWK